ncbi:MAG: XrtA/PEP-CTERM system-associated ATPase [Gammaproteobacteria bacterium]
MYEEFYKLEGKPFALNPDPRFFFKSKGHQRAMAYLRYGLQQGQGFIVVTGDVGTGKTMLVKNLFREIEDQPVIAAKLVSTNLDDHDLLRMVAANFDIAYEGRSKAALLLDVERQLQECVRAGQRVLLVIDEAQNLPRTSLEELRMLSNFELDGQPLVQSFLLGQREFRATLRGQGLEQVRQRIIAAYHLRPLNQEETKAYILHRLSTVGWKDDPQFDELVFAAVQEFTGGVPRRINTLVDRLLLHGCLEGAHRLTRREFDAVATEVESERGVDLPGDEGDGIDDLDPPAAPAAPVPRRQPATEPGQIVQVQQQLAAMQAAVERLSVAVAAPARTFEEPSPGERSWWKFAFFGALGIAVIGILAVILLLARR